MNPKILLIAALMSLPLASLAEEVPQPGRPGDQWSSYDFVPGDKVLFFTDFTTVGGAGYALSKLLNVSERLDIEDRGGTPWLRCLPPCAFDVRLPEKLPERFTVDFDYMAVGGMGVQFTAAGPDGIPEPGSFPAVASANTMAYGDVNNEIDRVVEASDKPIHISWSFDGQKVKGYVESYAGLNSNNAPVVRSSHLHFDFLGVDDPTLMDQNPPVHITNLRVAAGGNSLSFDQLIKDGRLVLRGILFDTGSDRIRPESTPVLAQVADLLNAHRELKLVVEGHTDNQGNPESNQTLSTKRAEAVIQWLLSRHQVAATQLTPKGFGQTKPAASNDTDEGRQANRRVELALPTPT